MNVEPNDVSGYVKEMSMAGWQDSVAWGRRGMDESPVCMKGSGSNPTCMKIEIMETDRTSMGFMESSWRPAAAWTIQSTLGGEGGNARSDSRRSARSPGAWLRMGRSNQKMIYFLHVVILYLFVTHSFISIFYVLSILFVFISFLKRKCLCFIVLFVMILQLPCILCNLYACSFY